MRLPLIPTFAVVLFLFSGASISRGFEKVYQCDSQEKTVDCRNCKDFGAGVRFMVGKTDRFVNEYYSNGMTISRERCNIVDDKNWVCQNLVDGALVSQTASMVGGRYSFVTNYGRPSLESYLCTR
jgi:hypothetical protein